MKPRKGGAGSGRYPAGSGEHPSSYSERPSTRYPGKPRAGVRPSELFPHGRNPDGSARTVNDPKPAPKR